ncbi:hypothetical protein ACFE04_018838 [Oxalis oulophora]
MKDSSVIWGQVRTQQPTTAISNPTRPVPKMMFALILFISITYVIYTLKLLSTTTTTTTRNCAADEDSPFLPSTTTTHHLSLPNQTTHDSLREPTHQQQTTNLNHIVFGIAASSKLWHCRKNYIKLWYKPNQMRGVVWLDNAVKTNGEESLLLPQIKISNDTSSFPYSNKVGHRSAIRISRIVSETLRLGIKNVRWFVMGDDDTVFVTDNLIRTLKKYDHTQYYYIGSLSESHLQNIYFSYGMAYGGGGFAISYPLAKALSRMQDRCISRYPGLYGSDDRMQACMAELGVPLTKELGFHQWDPNIVEILVWFVEFTLVCLYDVYGNLFGLLAAHPVTPLVSLHHLDVVEPIFPDMTQVEALQKLMVPMNLDSAGLMQQSICYHKSNRWTVSVSWGFAVQILRGIFSPREMEMPARTFLNWYRRADYTAYAFNTRPVSRNVCQKPFVFYFSNATYNSTSNETLTVYSQHRVPHPACRWKMADPGLLDVVEVYKRPDPHLWDRSPRRNCCRVKKSAKKGRIVIDVGVCRDGESIFNEDLADFSWFLKILNFSSHHWSAQTTSGR